MAKTTYPGTTLQPLQVLDFVLSGNQMVRAVFLPQPDQTGASVGHVALACVPAGMGQQVAMPGQSAPQSFDAAARLAFKFAQSEAARVNATITSARLQGEEFLEKADVEQLMSGSIPVTIV